jgi:hypothetical protein
MQFLFLLPVAGLVYMWIVRLFVRNFLFGWIAILVGLGLDYTFGMDRLVLLGLHVSPLDLLYLCLLPAGILRIRFYELRVSRVTVFAGCYLLLFCVSVGRGIPLFGVAAVGNESRGFISELLALLYFITIPRDPKLIKKVVIAHIALSAIYLLVCVASYAGLPVGGGLGVVGKFIAAETTRDADRALPANAACSIELSLILATSWAVYRRHKWQLPVLVGLLALAVIILQHRSVWAMLISTLLASLFLDTRFFRYLLTITGTITLVAALVVVSFLGLEKRLASDLKESATNGDTFTWRVEVVKRTIGLDQSVLSVFIGEPMGSGYTRLDPNGGGYTTDVVPHDEFVGQYLRVGVIGSALIFLFLLRPLYVYLRDPHSGALLYPAPEAWVFVCIAMWVFSFPYGCTVDGIGLVAMANGLIDWPARRVANVPSGRRLALASSTVTGS